MLTRRDVLRLAPAAIFGRAARAADAADFERIDTRVHIHRDAPALFASLGTSRWSGLDPVVCPTEADEPYDLESGLDSTPRGARASGGRLARASTFDARGFEDRDFAERTIARLRRSFDDGAIGVKAREDIGMAIRASSGASTRSPTAPPAAGRRGDRGGRPDARRPPAPVGARSPAGLRVPGTRHR